MTEPCVTCGHPKVRARGLCSFCYTREWRAGRFKKQNPATMPEIRRMMELAEAGMPAGSIGICLGVDFGTRRTPESVRYFLHRYHNWHGESRGRPFTGAPAERLARTR